MGFLAAGIGKATGLLNTKEAVGLGAGGLFGLAAGQALSPPKLPTPPQPPNPAQFLSPKPIPSLFSPGGDTANSTLFAGNRTPQIAGGKKTLLGQ